MCACACAQRLLQQDLWLYFLWWLVCEHGDRTACLHLQQACRAHYNITKMPSRAWKHAHTHTRTGAHTSCPSPSATVETFYSSIKSFLSFAERLLANCFPFSAPTHTKIQPSLRLPELMTQRALLCVRVHQEHQQDDETVSERPILSLL